ncbi:hypothetical protein BTE48_03630 [Oceanospirillum multiglobuliferum]|uniref:Uncharacterized protein n=1 Tax=Oceanospirillum multiglobuliferum TaxID=64969 RepID=A0A1V4T7E0_9GAMM|nr:hypothetical protein BTE48_03630 [Oceanospirillum multiglobuliferum]
MGLSELINTYNNRQGTTAIAPSKPTNPAFVLARDNWHRHYFKCKLCQVQHRSPKHRPPTNLCLEGQSLKQAYKSASH